MNRSSINYLTCGISMLLMIILCLPASGQTINVTMQLNTATNPDTVMEHHYVDVRGSCTGDNVPGITWGGDTGIIMQNIGGDYWETTFQMTSGDTMRFKFWTGFDASTNTFFNWGWEGPINPVDPLGGDSRSFIAGNQDTILSLQFYHGTETVRDQYWKPYETKPDTFAVYLRVNMAAFMETKDFDPATDGPVAVRGGAPLDPTDTWGTDIILLQEAGSIDNGSFFSGVGYIANSAVVGGEWQNFKFVYTEDGSVVWESTPNRFFQYSGAKDTTIHWAYFNNQRPTGGNIVEATLTWQMKTDGLEKLGIFDRSLGDRIVIDGAKAWDIDNPIEMEYVPLLQLWLAQEPFIKAPGAALEYKAVLLWHESRVDPTSPNFIPGKNLDSDSLRYWEEPSVTGSGNRYYTYTNQTEQMIPGDFGFDYQYFNGLPSEGVIETPITVTFNINMAPAADIASNPSNPLFRPGVDTVWVQLTECLMPLTQGEGIYENTPLLLQDLDGDLVYSGSLNLNPPTTYDAGFLVNYSSESGTIQNGGGFQKGRIYYQFVHPTAVHEDGTIEWPSEFSFPVLPWMDSDLTVEDAPDLWTPTGVQADNNLTVQNFELAQNYPNPFNPETTINYQVAEKSHVQINIYNLMGQMVMTLRDKQQTQGTYSIQWNRKDFKGDEVPSGLYFVKMAAGSFEQIKKMTLIR